MKRSRVSSAEAARIKETVEMLGGDTVRQIWRTEGKRLPSRERLANIEEGTGRLSPSEKARLNQLYRNRNALSRLQESGQENAYYDAYKREYTKSTKDRRIAHAMKSWMLHGKQPGVDYRMQYPGDKKKQQKAIKALIYLGIDIHSDDPDYGT